MNWENKNVFVTGADGFIGSWVAKKLVEKKANVIILVRDFKSEPPHKLLDLENRVTQVQGDITEAHLRSKRHPLVRPCAGGTLSEGPVGCTSHPRRVCPLDRYGENRRGNWHCSGSQAERTCALYACISYSQGQEGLYLRLGKHHENVSQGC